MKAVVVDFDGTICDSFEGVVQKINLFSNNFGYKKITEERLAEFKDMGLKSIVKTLGISFFELPFLVYAIRKELKNEIDSYPIFEGMKEVFYSLQRQGIFVGVLTSNTEENVRFFFDKHGLHYDFIYSKSSLFGKHRMLKRIIHDLKLHKDNLIHIGDEVRDIVASHKAGVKIISVSWGYNSKKILQRYKPNTIVENPKSLITAIKRMMHSS